MFEKILYRRYDKSAIAKLPTVEYCGKIVVVMNEYEAKRAVDYLLTCNALGIDTETRPSFKRGEHNNVSLLQVANDEVCFLFRFNFIGAITDDILTLLENKTIPLVGLSLLDDIHSLRKRRDFTPNNFIDLQNIVGDLGIEDKSLQKLYANIFGQRISKRQQLTNWDADILTDKQKAYAALDAWACLNLYREILQLKQNKNYTLQ